MAETTHTIKIAGKELNLKDEAVDALFMDFVRTTSIRATAKAQLIRETLTVLSEGEQEDLLEEIEKEQIFPLGYLVTA